MLVFILVSTAKHILLCDDTAMIRYLRNWKFLLLLCYCCFGGPARSFRTYDTTTVLRVEIDYIFLKNDILSVTITVNHVHRTSVNASLHDDALEFSMPELCEWIPQITCREIFESLDSIRQTALFQGNHKVYTAVGEKLPPQIFNTHLQRHASTERDELQTRSGRFDTIRIDRMQQMEKSALAHLLGLLESRIVGNLHLWKAKNEIQERMRDLNNKPRESRPTSERGFRRKLVEYSSFFPHRIAVIHSCLLPEVESSNIRILDSLLSDIRRYQLHEELLATVVLHYGRPFPDIAELQERFPFVVFLQVSDDLSFFELPTMRILHHVASWLCHNGSKLMATVDDRNSLFQTDYQILYMHTKGQSYTKIHQQMEDWRHYMSYFVLERHQLANHLLRSRVFDVFGVNYIVKYRTLSGNFWWASSRYLAGLSRVSLLDSKYAAELWTLSGANVRAFTPYSSDENIAVLSQFPRFCYAPLEDTDSENSSKSLPSFAAWKEVCPMLNLIQYQHIHMQQLGLGVSQTKTLIHGLPLRQSMRCIGESLSTAVKLNEK
jgi:hypothetical protein